MNNIPERKDVKKEDRWDLSKLYPSEEAWEKGLKSFEELIPGIADFKGKLGDSADSLKLCLDYMRKLEILEEKLGYYAHLRLNEDEGNGSSQERFARYMSAATKSSTESAWQTPEIQTIEKTVMDGFLADPALDEYRIMLKKVLRFKPHILSEAEEKLLAMQAEANQTASKTFSSLTNVDMSFGSIETPDGEIPLTQSTFSSFLINPDRKIREKAYFQFYQGFESHKNTIASLYAGSVHLDVYKARVRKHSSSRAAALFPDKVEENVYDNLLDTVGENLPALHDY
jgi:oligoendopeptidase F